MAPSGGRIPWVLFAQPQAEGKGQGDCIRRAGRRPRHHHGHPAGRPSTRGPATGAGATGDAPDHIPKRPFQAAAPSFQSRRPLRRLILQTYQGRKKAGLASWGRVSPRPRHGAAPRSAPSSHCPSPCRGEQSPHRNRGPTGDGRPPRWSPTQLPRTAHVCGLWFPGCPGPGRGEVAVFRLHPPAPQRAASAPPAAGRRAAVLPHPEAFVASPRPPRTVLGLLPPHPPPRPAHTAPRPGRPRWRPTFTW